MAEKVKFTLEYEIKSSSKILYSFISEPNGLAEWFSDDVRVKDHVYTFIWDDGEEQNVSRGFERICKTHYSRHRRLSSWKPATSGAAHRW